MKIVCPECDGKQQSRAIVCGKHQCTLEYIPCLTCKGRKWLYEDEYERYEQGKALYEDRKKRGMSLHAEAKRLGISMTKLSKRERGAQ